LPLVHRQKILRCSQPLICIFFPLVNRLSGDCIGPPLARLQEELRLLKEKR
jgi:hypothetical protein